MQLRSFGRLVVAGLAGLVVAQATPVSPVRAATAAGTIVSNAVSATYSDGLGNPYATTSNTVSLTVAAVGALAVGPKEQGCNASADGFVVGQTFVKTFTVTNDSNTPDAYTIQSAATSAGAIQTVAFADGSGASLPATIGSTVSPTLQPGATLQILVTIGNTASIPVGSDVSVTIAVRSTNTQTANGLQSDTGVQCGVAMPGAALSSTAGPGLQIQKLVNGVKSVSANGGATITYSIAFENFGGTAATNVTISDAVPAGLAVDPTSVKINGLGGGVKSSLTGQTLNVQVGTVPVDTPETISFTATVQAQQSVGAVFVNTANVSADGLGKILTMPATVLIGTANVVYDGYVGASAPIAGASVQLIDPRTGRALALPASGEAPNASNADPFVTGADGSYAFDLGATQLAGTYDLLLTAPGYLNRKIQITLVPDASGTLYTVTIAALDGQPLAVAGGFTVTAGPVSIADIFGFFGNIPMFQSHPVTITKSSDRSFAAGGDRVVFSLAYADGSPTPLGATSVVDTLPPGMVYAPGTGRVDRAPVEPTVAGRVLTWTFPALAGAHTITYAAVILPGTEAGATLQNDVTIAAGIPNEPGRFASASANADVQVTSGVFTTSTVITGRVYLDVADTGHVAPNDVWLPNVRVYLEDGESSVTDRSGRFSFPGVRPGMHVIRLDPTTLPDGVHAFDEHSYDSERSTRRLVHHLYDSGLIEDINFALAGSVQP